MGAKFSRFFGGHSSPAKDDGKKPKRWGSLRRQKSEDRRAPERSATLPARPRPPESAVQPSVPPTVAEDNIDELQKATVSKPVESAPPLPQPTIVPEYIEDKTFKTYHEESVDHTTPVVERVAAKPHVEAAVPQAGIADADIAATVVPIGDARIGDTDFEKPPGGQLDFDAEQPAKQETEKVMYIQHDMAVHVEEPFTSIAEPGSTETPTDQPAIVQYSSAMHVQPDFPHASTVEPIGQDDMVIGEPKVAFKANSPELIVESTVSDSNVLESIEPNSAASTVHAEAPLPPEHADSTPSVEQAEKQDVETEEHHVVESQQEELPSHTVEGEYQTDQHAAPEQGDEQHTPDEQQEEASEVVESEPRVEQQASPEQADKQHTADQQHQEETSEAVESEPQVEQQASPEQADKQHTADEQHQEETSEAVESEPQVEQQASHEQADKQHTTDEQPEEPTSEPVEGEQKIDEHHFTVDQQDIASENQTEEHGEIETEHHAEQREAPPADGEQIDTSDQPGDGKPQEQDLPPAEDEETEGVTEETADAVHEEGSQQDVEDKHTEDVKSHEHENEHHTEDDQPTGHDDDSNINDQHEVEATDDLPKSEEHHDEGEVEGTSHSGETGDHVDEGAHYNSVSEGQEEHVNNVVDDAINSSLLELSSGKLDADPDVPEHKEAGDVVENHEQ